MTLRGGGLVVTTASPSAGRKAGSGRFKRVLLWFVALALIAGVGVLAWSEITSSTPRLVGITQANYRAVAEADGRLAPNFALPELGSDRVISLGEMRGRVIVLNMWATWCAPCRLEASSFESTWRKYRDENVNFLGVNERDQEAQAMSFQEEFDLTYPSVFDPSGRVGFLYDVVGMPTTFIITRDGTIMYRFVGYLAEPVLSSAIDDALAEP